MGIVVRAVCCVYRRFCCHVDGRLRSGHDVELGEAYPVKPIRMLFGFSAGGGAGESRRGCSRRKVREPGQNVVVENAPVRAARSPTKRLRERRRMVTRCFMPPGLRNLPALRPKLAYDIERDLAPVSLVVITSFALSVHPSVPARDVKALIALARAQPGKLLFGSPGIGSSAHFAGELFNMMAGVRMLHVPFKGPPEATTAVVAGHTDVAFPSVTGALPFVSTGKMKVLSVSSAKRAPLLPSVPTLDEAGIAGYQRAGWNGVMVPARGAEGGRRAIDAAVVKTSVRRMKDAFVKLGLEGQPGTTRAVRGVPEKRARAECEGVKFAESRWSDNDVRRHPEDASSVLQRFNINWDSGLRQNDAIRKAIGEHMTGRIEFVPTRGSAA